MPKLINNILITGGAKRIGKKISEMISKLPYTKNLIIHYNNSHNEALELKTSLENKNTNIYLYKADFTKIEEIESLLKFIKENFNQLNILINNASLFQKTPLKQTDNNNDFLNYSNIHTAAPFLLSKFLINSKSDKKIIINMLDERRSSNKSICNYGEYFYYSMTKHMMFLMHQYLQKEFNQYNEIRIHGLIMSLILPNNTDIDFFKKNHIDEKISNTKISKILRIIKKILMNDLENKNFKI